MDPDVKEIVRGQRATPTRRLDIGNLAEKILLVKTNPGGLAQSTFILDMIYRIRVGFQHG